MTQGTPTDNNDETVALRRSDVPRSPQDPQSPQHGAPPPPFAQPARSGRSVGVLALVLALIGGGVAAFGLFAVRWTRVGDTSDGDVSFLSLRRTFSLARDSNLTEGQEWTATYFIWAGLVLFGASLVLAVVSALPTPATPVLRVVGLLIGLACAAAALFVPLLDGNEVKPYLDGGLGLFIAAGGAVLMAIGALIGSRRRA